MSGAFHTCLNTKIMTIFSIFTNFKFRKNYLLTTQTDFFIIINCQNIVIIILINVIDNGQIICFKNSLISA